VLRNPLDTQTAVVPGTVMANLFSDSGRPVATARPHPSGARPRPVEPTVAAPPPKPAPELFLVEVLNGARRTEVKFAPAAEVKP
jgi:hypothetical protein